MSRQSSIHGSRDGDEDLQLTDDEIEDLDAQLAGLDLSANFAVSITTKGTTTSEEKDDEEDYDMIGADGEEDQGVVDDEDDICAGDPLAAPPPDDSEDEDDEDATTGEGTPKAAMTSSDSDGGDDQSAAALFHRIFKKRIDRDEVFSKHYTATTEEAKEVASIAKGMGVYGTQYELFDFHSILCMRGKVLVGGGTTKSGGMPPAPAPRELFLLTHGYVMARVSNYSSFSGIVSSLVQSSMVCLEPYSEIEYIRDQPLLKSPSFVVKTKSEEYVIQCPTMEDKKAWFYAWERVLVADRSMTPDPDRELGWQHKLVQTSLWSAAVTGSAATLQTTDHSTDFNQLDRYNELGVLHYTVLYNQMHMLQHLLEQDGRAFADLQDGEGRTPMYYAQRDGNEEAIKLLQDIGYAQPSQLWEQEQTGVLTTQVVQLEEERKRKKEKQKQQHEGNRKSLFRGRGSRDDSSGSPMRARGIFKAFGGGKHHNNNNNNSTSPAQEQRKEQKEQQQKAESAKSQMAENMQLVAERGEKIDDLQEKTNQMQEGIAEYASLAKQLKEQSKQKKWYQL